MAAIFQWIGTCIARKTLYFCNFYIFFFGGGRTHPSGFAHGIKHKKASELYLYYITIHKHSAKAKCYFSFEL